MPFYCSKITRRYAFAFLNLCCIIGLLLSMYSIVNPRWYGAETHRGEIPTDPTTIDGGLATSPWYTCTRTSNVWQCEEFAISGLAAYGTCAERSKNYVRDNVYAIRAAIIITGAFLAMSSVAATAISGLGPTYVRSGTNILIVLTSMATIWNIIGIIISAVFFKSKLYCGGGYCEILRRIDPTIETCDEMFYHGALCFYIGLLCPIFALAAAVYLRASAVAVIAVARPPPLANRRGRHFTDAEMATASNFHSRTHSNASAYAYGGNNFYAGNKLGGGGMGESSVDPNNYSHANNNYNAASTSTNKNAQPMMMVMAGNNSSTTVAHQLPLQSTSSPIYSRGVSPRNLAAGNNNSTAPTTMSPTNKGANNNNNNATQEPSFHGQSGPAGEEPEVTFQPPEGDWEWDPNSNMYWSESQYLFLNPNDGHFFDPNSEQWYNPETEVWYS